MWKLYTFYVISSMKFLALEYLTAEIAALNKIYMKKKKEEKNTSL